jgi:hypothetical protein
MDVRAVVVVGAPEESYETIAGEPYAFADVLGQPVVYRVLDRLKATAEISALTVVTEAPPSIWPVGANAANGRGTWMHAAGDQLWRAGEQAFADYAQAGAEHILILRVGAYTELDFADFLKYHAQQQHHVTCAVDPQGLPLDIYAVSGSRRNDAARLFRHHLRKFRGKCQYYPFDGYLNRLTSPHDLRHMAIAGLMQRIQIRPEGAEIKPGVWVGRGAQIHRRARVLSPAFIGAGCRVRAASVITRCCSLEHHTVVDCGTVVENVSTLPFTYLGAGLDVTHSVVGRSRVWNLKRSVEVEFADARLIGEASPNAPLRALGSLLSLASFFPAQFLRGLFAPSHRECPASLPGAISTPAAALETPASRKAAAPAVDAGEFPANLAVARRYGNE